MNLPTWIATCVILLLAASGASSDSKTGHYLECLSEDQCKQVDGRCCPIGFCCDKYTMTDGQKITSKCISEESDYNRWTYTKSCKPFSLTPEQLSDPGHFIRPMRLEIAKQIGYPMVMNILQDQFFALRDIFNRSQALADVNSRIPAKYQLTSLQRDNLRDGFAI